MCVWVVNQLFSRVQVAFLHLHYKEREKVTSSLALQRLILNFGSLRI
jgi:hypothetical protein